MKSESTMGYVCFWPDGQMCSCTVSCTEDQAKANAELERIGYTVRPVRITIEEGE